MHTMNRLALLTSLLALGGCSVIVDSGNFTGGTPGDGGVADTGTGDTGTGDTGTGDTGMGDGSVDAAPVDAGACTLCPTGQVMLATGHCVIGPDCGTCGPEEVCDPLGSGCWSPPRCPMPLPSGIICSAYGPVPECQCPDRTSTRSDPMNPDPRCFACGDSEHYVAEFGACVRGAHVCAGDGACTPPETCRSRFPGDATYCADDTGGPGCLAPNSPCGGGCFNLMMDRNHCGSCGVSCSGPESCVGGGCTSTPPPPVDCMCPSGDLCVEGGTCIASGTCVRSAAFPSCEGGSTMSGVIPAFRVSTMPYGTQSIDDLHITGNVTSTTTAVNPGWTMFWRDGGRAIQAAFADASLGAAGMACYTGGHIDRVGICGSSGPFPNFDLMDARSVYAGTGRPPQPITAMATGVGPMASPAVELWDIEAETSTGSVPTRACVRRVEAWTSGPGGTILPPVRGVAIDALGSFISVFATLGFTSSAPTLGRFDAPPTEPPHAPKLFVPTDTGFSGPLAAGFGMSLHARTDMRSVTVWDGSAMTGSYILTGSDRIDTDPVAAIAPEGDGTNTFVYGVQTTTDSGLQSVTCSPPTCTRSTAYTVPRVRNSPVAAYRLAGTTTVFAWENGGSAGNALVARTSMSTLTTVLDDGMVGGTITDMLALDAEGVMNVNSTSLHLGWDYVWAAFVIVERGSDKSLELWTGAHRVCGV